LLGITQNLERKENHGKKRKQTSNKV
jgi:hypothetical protein